MRRRRYVWRFFSHWDGRCFRLSWRSDPLYQSSAFLEAVRAHRAGWEEGR